MACAKDKLSRVLRYRGAGTHTEASEVKRCGTGSLVNVDYASRGSHARGRGSGRRGQMQIGGGAEERCLSVVGY